jgi:hypothetical protein
VVVTLLATVLVLGVAHEAALRLEARQRLRFGGSALACGQGGLEAAARKAALSSTWRSDPTTWLDQRQLGDGRVTVVASDPVDGLVAVDGARGSSSADGVRLTATAIVNGLSRGLRADYLPLPHEALTQAVYGRSHICAIGVAVEGRIRCNGEVLDYGSTAVHGDITTVTGATVSPGFDDADTDILYVASSLAMPAVGFSWFQAAGQRITLPVSRAINNTRITSTFNPYGSASPRGIYWIDAGGGDIYLYQVAIEACLAVLNARTVYIGSADGQTTPYYHRSPDPDRLPALAVQGNLTMRVEGGLTIVIPGGSLADTYSCDLDGVFLCTGTFWGPQLGATTSVTLDGAILGGSVHLRGPGTRIRHDPNLNLNPVVEMTRPGLRLVAGGTQEM